MTVYYTGNGCFMTSDELYHHGVKGMKWGRRKARPQSTGNGRHGAQADRNSPEAKAARKAKAVKAAKIGAAIVGTALAAYGAKKLSDSLKDKAYKSALERGQKATSDLIKHKVHTDYMQAVYEKNFPKQREIDAQLSKLTERLVKSDIAYAERASRNTVSAIKELTGKNYELPLATLKKMGIKTIDL